MHDHLNVKNKIGTSVLKHVVYLLEYRTRISPLKSSYKKWSGGGGGIALELPACFNIFCE